MNITKKEKDILIGNLYKRHKRLTKRRSIEHTLSLGEFKILAGGACVYCGASPSNSFKGRGLELAYQGIDRVNSALGYIESNCVSSCRFCNTLKGSMPASTWIDFLQGIIHNHFGEIPDWMCGYSDPGRPKKSNWHGRR